MAGSDDWREVGREGESDGVKAASKGGIEGGREGKAEREDCKGRGTGEACRGGEKVGFECSLSSCVTGFA